MLCYDTSIISTTVSTYKLLNFLCLLYSYFLFSSYRLSTFLILVWRIHRSFSRWSSCECTLTTTRDPTLVFSKNKRKIWKTLKVSYMIKILVLFYLRKVKGVGGRSLRPLSTVIETSIRRRSNPGPTDRDGTHVPFLTVLVNPRPPQDVVRRDPWLVGVVQESYFTDTTGSHGGEWEWREEGSGLQTDNRESKNGRGDGERTSSTNRKFRLSGLKDRTTTESVHP